MPAPGSVVPESVPAPAPEHDRSPLLTILAGLPTGSHELRLGTTFVGRSVDTDWQLRHPEVSRRHCRFDWTAAGLCTVEDLASRWGTKINGAALSPDVRAPLQTGDVVQIGPVQVFFGFGPPPDRVVAAGREAGSDPDAAPPIRGPQVLMGSREVRLVPLDGGRVRFGRQGEVEVILADPGISRQHAVVERAATGFQVTDLRSRAGSLVNGRRFETHPLVIGDLLQMGPFFFRFDGRALERTTGLAGVEIDVRSLRKMYGTQRVLDDVTLRVDRGTFVGILGPSGAGKSSLLNALTGLRPADAGTIRFDGANLYQEYDRLRSLLGYVPQDDIVHRELTVSEALFFSARLRLPALTPEIELRKLVAQTVERLGLSAQANARVQTLSGGQRKRVSVGVELLGRPAVLFLDEPTSGLDPAAEFKMMGLLRTLADGGCTVVCTTHVMENVYLTDRLFIVTGGRMVFAGDSAAVREHFDVPKLSGLYDRLAERTPEEWSRDPRRRFQDDAPPGPGTGEPSPSAGPLTRPPRPNPATATLPVLLRRQWAILRSDPRNFLILFGQPLLIGLLVVWVTDDVSLTLFFAYLATLWFGCSNAAQEIVRELPIYRRERTVGLGRDAYLLSKFSLLGTLTALQGVFLYACLGALRWWLYPDALPSRGLDGSWLWQGGSVVCTAYAAAGIGLAVSALARDAMQAMMIVPLVLIPQILFSGLVVETRQMPRSAFVLAGAMPSYAAQTMMDVGAFWRRPITGDLYNAREKAREHLQHLLRRELEGRPTDALPAPPRELAKSAFGMNKTYDRADVGLFAALKLLAWTLLSYGAAWLGLRARERG